MLALFATQPTQQSKKNNSSVHKYLYEQEKTN